MENIKDRIYVETGFLGCNPSFVLTKEGVVMIDTPQQPMEAFRWKKVIQEFGKVLYLINTDHHFDHSLGNFYFDADMIMHQGTAKRLLAEERVQKSKEWIRMLDPSAAHLIENYYVRRPRVTYESKITLSLGEEIFELIHVSSHTEDETLVYLPKLKVLITGDTVCTCGIPSTYESYPIQWLDALRSIQELDFDVVVPGHGKIGDRQAVTSFHAQFGGLVEAVRDKLMAGYDRDRVIREIEYEDVVHSQYPPPFSRIFANQMSKNIGRIYDQLTAGSSCQS
jgi:cyclase